MRIIIVCLSAFNESLATTIAFDLRIIASLLSWFLPLIASHGLFAAPLERLSCAPGTGALLEVQVLP